MYIVISESNLIFVEDFNIFSKLYKLFTTVLVEINSFDSKRHEQQKIKVKPKFNKKVGHSIVQVFMRYYSPHFYYCLCERAIVPAFLWNIHQ